MGSPESKLCPHDRLTTGFCEPCGALEYGEGFDGMTSELLEKPAGKIDQKVTQPDGSNAAYYDFPYLRTAMDMIEWLSLDFSNGNVLKSLIRENNPDAQKKSTALYEAEKRVYYATRHLQRVQALQE